MIAELEDRSFDQFVQAATTPVLVEFWQPACSHCRALSHELELLQSELGNRIVIRKMNVQENHLIPADLEIQSLPALALFVNGEFQTYIGGIGKKKELMQQLEPWLLNSEPDL
ncbi:MAG: thioredoxin [Nitrospirales bacterium]|nr:MAG: thioredoxin [Nitrospirales bacterium]